MAKMTIAQEIAKKRQELAELEAKQLDELEIGALIHVTGEGKYDDVPVGSIAIVTEINPTEKAVDARNIDGSDWDQFAFGSFVIVTREEAREILIAEIDKQLEEVYA